MEQIRDSLPSYLGIQQANMLQFNNSSRCNKLLMAYYFRTQGASPEDLIKPLVSN